MATAYVEKSIGLDLPGYPSTTPLGRVMTAMLIASLRIGRSRGNVLSQTYVLNIQLEGYKVERVQEFVGAVKAVLQEIPEAE